LTTLVFAESFLYCYVRYSATNSSWRSGIPSCWITVVGQLSVQPMTVRPYLYQFRRALKMYLFGWLRLQHLVTFVCGVLYQSLYLLTAWPLWHL